MNFAEISKNTFCYRATSGGCSKKKERKKSQMIIIVGVDNQKQPAEVFYKKGVLKDSSKFTGKYLYQSLFFNKVAGLWLWHRCLRVIFARFLRKPLLQNTSGWLFLDNREGNCNLNIYHVVALVKERCMLSKFNIWPCYFIVYRKTNGLEVCSFHFLFA